LKKWICKVCGYEHVGDAPPDVCPICRVGPEKFALATEETVVPKEPTKPEKQWKCTVCDYIHAGDNPPDVCPICGVGSDKFVLVTSKPSALTAALIDNSDEGSARAALEKISYGLYVVTSKAGDKINGQCANTVFQITSQPSVIAVGLNKANLTHEYVMESQVVTISILRHDDVDSVRNFGYSSGRNKDKFADTEYILGRNGCPIVKGCIAYIEAKVLPGKVIDIGTHSLFIAEVTAGNLVEDVDGLTYALYQKLKAGKK